MSSFQKVYQKRSTFFLLYKVSLCVVMVILAISVSLSALLYYILPLGKREHYRCVVQKKKKKTFALVRIVSGSCYLLYLDFFNTSSP